MCRLIPRDPEIPKQQKTSIQKKVPSLKLTVKTPENSPGPKRKLILQPSIFRCERLLVLGSVFSSKFPLLAWRFVALNKPLCVHTGPVEIPIFSETLWNEVT